MLMIFFQIDFYMSMSQESRGFVLFLHMDFQMFQHCLLKRLSFVYSVTLTTLLKICCMCGLISRLHYFIDLSILMTILMTVVDYSNFIISLKIR